MQRGRWRCGPLRAVDRLEGRHLADETPCDAVSLDVAERPRLLCDLVTVHEPAGAVLEQRIEARRGRMAPAFPRLASVGVTARPSREGDSPRKNRSRARERVISRFRARNANATLAVIVAHRVPMDRANPLPPGARGRVGPSLFRLALGTAQMMGAAIAILTILHEGLTRRAVVLALVTTLVTAVSRLLPARLS
jgi:hypothetical protein